MNIFHARQITTNTIWQPCRNYADFLYPSKILTIKFLEQTTKDRHHKLLDRHHKLLDRYHILICTFTTGLFTV